MLCWMVSYLPAIAQWYRLKWITTYYMQVIVVVRLHAMYQRSRKMLIFLLLFFLAFQIAACVMAGIHGMGVSYGKLRLQISDLCASGYRTNIRGVHLLWRLSVWWQLFGKRRIYDGGGLDIGPRMGDPHTVFSSLDCCKTLPWAATIIKWMDSCRLFHGIDRKSRVLLRKVSS